MKNVFDKKAILARLLSTENIEVVQGQFRTASFNVSSRVLNLPYWDFEDLHVYDLMIGHEVGHALFTKEKDLEGVIHNEIPMGFYNVVEDVRIENKIVKSYPGLSKQFTEGYKTLFKKNFFETDGDDINDYSFMNRVNLQTKLRNSIDIEFSDTERVLLNKVKAVDTWQDVVDVVQEIYDFLNEKQEKNEPDSDFESKFKNDSAQADENDENVETGDSESQDEVSEESINNELDSEAFDEFDVETYDEFNIETYDNLHKNLENVVANDDETLVVSSLSDDQFQDMTNSYDEIVSHKGQEDFYRFHYAGVEFKRVMHQAEKIASSMAIHFEMKKAATRYSKAKVSKSGKIDVNKLYSYKINDDIFLRNLSIPDDKSHGIVMLFDRSRSMLSIYPKVIRQIIILALFCKKVNIPFEIYGFTGFASNLKKEESNEVKTFKHSVDLGISHHNVFLNQYLSSDMSRNKFKEAIEYLFHTQNINGTFGYNFMWCTPLHTILTGIPKYLQDFKKKANVQKVSFITLTDGVSDDISKYLRHPKFEYTSKSPFFDKNIKVRFHDNTSIKYDLIFTCNVMEKIQKMGFNTITYFLTERVPHEAISYMSFRPDAAYGKLGNKENRGFLIRNNYLVLDDVPGHDKYAIIVFNDAKTHNNSNRPMPKTLTGQLNRISKEFAQKSSKSSFEIIIAKDIVEAMC